MKNLFVILMFVVLSFNANAATEGTCGPRTGSGTTADPYVFADNCKYKIENGVLTITGSGNMGSMCHNGACSVWTAEKDTISKVVIAEGITSIGSNAFIAFTNLKDVEIPKTVQSIGDRAFEYNIAGINHLNIPNGVTALPVYLGSTVKKLTIPDSVTTFPNGCCNFGRLAPADITISAVNLEKYLAAGGRLGGNLVVDCTSGDCMTLLNQWDQEHGTHYSANAQISLKSADGSTSIYKNGQLIGLKGKIIYTVQEAEMLAKPTGNKFIIRYK